MELIDRYVHEVGQNLPAKLRPDLEVEIRSLIEDTLEDRSQAAGRAPDEAMVVEVLKEFGSPAKMAASYLPPRYLIGPRLFPTFFLVMRLILGLIALVAVVQLGVNLGQPGVTWDSAMRLLGSSLVSFLTSALAALGNVVFIFALLEWALPKLHEKKENWDPRSLRSVNEPEQVRMWPQIWEIAFTLIALLLFNVYPQVIGMGYQQGGQWNWSPVLSAAFFRYLPFLNVLWVLHIALNVVLLRVGRWQPATRWFRVGLEVLGLIVLAIMISGPSIINLNFTAFNMDLSAAETLRNLASTGVRMLMVMIFVLDGFGLLKGLYQSMIRRTAPVIEG